MIQIYNSQFSMLNTSAYGVIKQKTVPSKKTLFYGPNIGKSSIALPRTLL